MTLDDKIINYENLQLDQLSFSDLLYYQRSWAQTITQAIEKQRIKEGIAAKLNPRGFGDLASIRQQERKFIVGKYIPASSLVEIIGRAGEHKSFLALDLAMKIVSGRKWLDEFETSKGEVLMVDEENGPFELSRRTGLLEKPGEDYSGLHWLSMEGISLSKEDTQRDLRDYLQAHPAIKIVIIDSFRRVANIDENDSQEVNEFLNKGLKPLITELGITVIALHHLRKRDKKAKDEVLDMEDARGSGDIGAMADSVMLIRTKKEDANQIVLSHAKSRTALAVPPQDILVVSRYDERGREVHIDFICQGAADAKKTQEEKAADIILKSWDSIASEDLRFKLRKEIVNAMALYGLSEDSVDRALALLKNNRSLELWENKAGRYYKSGTLRLTDYNDSEGPKTSATSATSAPVRGKEFAEEVPDERKKQDEGRFLTEPTSPHPRLAEVPKSKNADDKSKTSATSANDSFGSGRKIDYYDKGVDHEVDPE